MLHIDGHPRPAGQKISDTGHFRYQLHTICFSSALHERSSPTSRAVLPIASHLCRACGQKHSLS
eukprot:11207801-Lingulodinium_polyedra.AAC.1